jgi:hypothetical protein
MALANIGYDFCWPGVLTNGGTIGFTAGNTIATTGHYEGFTIRAQEDMTLSHVAFRCHNSSGSPTCNIRIETVDAATGLPTGSLWATNTEGTTGAITIDNWYTQALTASATITKGQYFAVLFVKTATGTNFQISTLNNTDFFVNYGMPARIVNTTGTAVHSGPTAWAVQLGSSSTSFYKVRGLFPFRTTTAMTANVTTTQALALKFVAPFSGRIAAIRYNETSNSTANDFEAAILNSSGTVLNSSTTAVDKSITRSGGSPTQHFIQLTNPVTVTAGSTYYAAIIPTTSTDVSCSRLAPNSSDYATNMPGGGSCHGASRSGSTWTEHTNSYIFIEPVFDQLDDGAGGGGSSPSFSAFVG